MEHVTGTWNMELGTWNMELTGSNMIPKCLIIKVFRDHFLFGALGMVSPDPI